MGVFEKRHACFNSHGGVAFFPNLFAEEVVALLEFDRPLASAVGATSL
jgi:hypothetical protein